MCQQPTVLPTRNNGATSTLVAEVDVSGAATVLAATAAASGPGGSYGATNLSATGSWSAGGSAGDFSWSYPMDLPASLGGPTPSIGLGYSSSSVDGRMVSTNNQATWVGDGWDYWPGYVERRYKSCTEDMGSGALNTEKTGDLCWASNNVTLSLNGRTTELVRDDDTGTWRTAEDDGSRIEALTGASNGDNNGEYWRVTTTDGTQYYFGRNRLPNWSTNARRRSRRGPSRSSATTPASHATPARSTRLGVSRVGGGTSTMSWTRTTTRWRTTTSRRVTTTAATLRPTACSTSAAATSTESSTASATGRNTPSPPPLGSSSESTSGVCQMRASTAPGQVQRRQRQSLA
ncbi:hypothetical protein NKG94_16840 [Micromonospora sp. M12]